MNARASYTRKLLRLFYEEKLCKKTLYFGIVLICESPKQCLIITKPCLVVFVIVSVCSASLQKVLKGKSDAYK